VITFLTFPTLQVRAPETFQLSAIGAESSRATDTSTNTPPGKPQQEHRRKLVRRDAAILATKHMTQEVHLKTVRKTGRSKNKNQHTIKCESIHLDVDNGELTISFTAGVRMELHDQTIATRNTKPAWPAMAFVRKVRETEH
jgi:hypothetical protein